MKIRIGLYVAVGVIAFVLGLVVYLPASLVAGWVSDATPLRLDGVTGTALDGKAAYVALPAGALNNVAWHLHPATLLLGQLSASVVADTDLADIKADVARGVFGGNTLSDIRGQATIGWLAKLASITFVPLSGRIGLDVRRVSFDDNFTISALQGQVTLTDSRWQLRDPPLKLGRFQAKLEQADDGLQANIVDSGGPLALNGRARLIDQSRFEINARLRARAGADKRLQSTLSQIGQPDSQGWYHVQQRGRF